MVHWRSSPRSLTNSRGTKIMPFATKSTKISSWAILARRPIKILTIQTQTQISRLSWKFHQKLSSKKKINNKMERNHQTRSKLFTMIMRTIQFRLSINFVKTKLNSRWTPLITFWKGHQSRNIWTLQIQLPNSSKPKHLNPCKNSNKIIKLVRQTWKVLLNFDLQVPNNWSTSKSSQICRQFYLKSLMNQIRLKNSKIRKVLKRRLNPKKQKLKYVTLM